MIEVLRLTGFRTVSEFFENTSFEERVFLLKAIKEWREETQGWV